MSEKKQKHTLVNEIIFVRGEPESTCIKVQGGRQKNKQCHPESENDDDDGGGSGGDVLMMMSSRI